MPESVAIDKRRTQLDEALLELSLASVQGLAASHGREITDYGQFADKMQAKANAVVRLAIELNAVTVAQHQTTPVRRVLPSPEPTPLITDGYARGES